jgi:uncharacterized protein YdiU (UPF0061 family)
MLREYLISEAMHHLGIPTTRSLAVTATGLPVFRSEPLPGAVLTRTAASHIRVGTFEWVAARDSKELLAALVDYTLHRHFPSQAESTTPAATLLDAVIGSQAALVARWIHVGFVHGVMNTDNMALSGQTIDYGPCAFMDRYHPDTVFSSIDRYGRYAYAKQPLIAQWNLARFAETLLPLLHPDPKTAVEIATEKIHGFTTQYQDHWLQGYRLKLGLFHSHTNDIQLVQTLLDWMEKSGADYTRTFASLSQTETNLPSTRPCADPMATPMATPMADSLADPDFAAWHHEWKNRLAQENQPAPAVTARMQQHNPAVIPRNHAVESALQAAEQEDLTPFLQLLDGLKAPYDFERKRPAALWAEPPKDAPPYRTFCGT